jgi:hypothetical protein
MADNDRAAARKRRHDFVLGRDSRDDLLVGAKRRVAEHDVAEPVDLHALAERPRLHRRQALGAQLVGTPRGTESLDPLDHQPVGVAAHELCVGERREDVECLRRERAGDRVAADDDRLDSLAPDVVEDGFESG